MPETLPDTRLPDEQPRRDPGSSGSPATDFSLALLSAFVRLGVRDVVLSPGARSQALALVAAELERLSCLRLHVRLDERSAGFLALGLSSETGQPALVLMTSGTAVANLHPAVLEAHHSGVPLIVLSADRPAELRGIRSNQTTVQPGMFGTAPRLSEDVPAPEGDPQEATTAADLAQRATDAALGIYTRDPGPVHLNLAFREPLSAAIELDADHISAADGPTVPAVVAREPATEIDPQVGTVVIAGTGSGPEAEEFARAGDWPLLAEVVSGARFGPNLVVAYRELLAEASFGGAVTRAIVFGHPTLSREIPALLHRDGVEVIVVAPFGAEKYNPGHRVHRFVSAVVASPASVAAAVTSDARRWRGRWVITSRELLASDSAATAPAIDARGITRSELAFLRAPITRAMLADAVWAASWPHDRLVFGASRLIREADRRVPGKKISVHSNRGLAGIDGTVATAFGIAAASQGGAEPRSAGTTRVLLGDLTLLHDVGSLLLTPGEPLPRLQVIVGVDGGGSIFDGLEVAATAPTDALDRVLFTPRRVDLRSLAAAYGWDYARAETRTELEHALTGAPTAPMILEVPLAR
ncbi:2-succinyl-5-enolpyruvyl-6-hydroxy-3-cyclohexene-1-carboxylic-acid synthase [Cryobacterium melibiosiphilum]|uniref:2-succinyl-5-enolpyruvyl-6-hydroxy-3-cyclohexene-1-carboxylate synthase n=1 Tax=Cryobacterium melibiosiphilum TaxID=995039 RepID=A0A3A5MSM3_9MICO|nr:2-succinyl-5-enolpyruvyl-6-hydroxy-3-cyclohexene-1-carboxylic-acid synthase [Cryobacterium melibiosiphilum]RJT90138.1 2-succinyl-5-enolpyruvyl-6-hydroxy-3-cyclohexene-1-carboxylic-acid synthase [Cryobacterium melibiosiphilum]